jgi:hypothetical protein
MYICIYIYKRGNGRERESERKRAVGHWREREGQKGSGLSRCRDITTCAVETALGTAAGGKCKNAK